MTSVLLMVAVLASKGFSVRTEAKELHEQMTGSPTREEGLRILKILNDPKLANEKAQLHPIEPLNAYLRLRMDDSIQSVGLRYIQAHLKPGSCPLLTSVEVASSYLYTNKPMLARSLLETSFGHCIQNNSEWNVGRGWKIRLSHLVAVILLAEGKRDSARMVLAPWLMEGLSTTAFVSFANVDPKRLCSQIQASLDRGLQRHLPRPKMSTPLLQFLADANNDPADEGLRLEPYRLSIPIYYESVQPSTEQFRNEAIIRFKNSFFYQTLGCSGN